MITSKQIQNSYNDLYECIHEYIWPFEFVNDLANLEISVYNTFPNVKEVRSNFDKVASSCQKYQNVKDDKDLNKSLSSMKDLIYSDDTIYAKLNNQISE